MLTTPFLTDLDRRAAIKGSRDPIGVQPIWTRLGRQVIGNLTTVSASVPNFTVLLLGYYFAERVAEAGGTVGELATFLKWEQIAAYVRASVNEKDEDIRGIERVKRRLADGHRVQLGIDSASQILSNQRTYGLWGLYTVPARASGLIEGDPSRLTRAARDVVESSMLPVLEAAGARALRDLLEILKKDSYLLDLREGSRDHGVVRGVAGVLSRVRKTERSLYREHLLEGGPGDREPDRGTQGRQRELAALLVETLDEPDWGLTPEAVAALSTRARVRGDVGIALADRLDDIRRAEQLVAPAAVLFEYVLGCHDQTPTEIAEGIRAHWGHALRSTIDLDALITIETSFRGWGDADSGRRWIRLAAALHNAAYEDAIYLLLAQNEVVMKARSSGAAWATVRDGKLQVRFRDATPAHLPTAEVLPSYWRHSYFIGSLRSITRGVTQ